MDVASNIKTENVGQSAITYVGESDGSMTFNIKYNNSTVDKMLLEVLDDAGNVLYKHLSINKLQTKIFTPKTRAKNVE